MPEPEVVKDTVFFLVNEAINPKGDRDGKNNVFYWPSGSTRPWHKLPALEDKVAEWSMEHPVTWNVGVGPDASFAGTLTRLLSERIKDIFGPYDHIIRVRLSPAAAACSSTAQHWVALEVLMEAAATVKVPLPDSELQELMQLAAEESYFGYGATFSSHLMLKAFGLEY
ncbi:hypothetical protein BS78_K012400 [Paspalum vaginatum]|uniref:Uncharacterized protein n=1 Tax=Paspalum vaginatum TaxID=158149 RepID=A0A9W8CEJ9_9POAL|nr:hypothetical protein BS78_K012400 [Paspalum vaginatum]